MNLPVVEFVNYTMNDARTAVEKRYETTKNGEKKQSEKREKNYRNNKTN